MQEKDEKCIKGKERRCRRFKKNIGGIKMRKRKMSITIPSFTFEADVSLSEIDTEEYRVNIDNFANNIPDKFLDIVYPAIMKTVKKEFKIKDIKENKKMESGHTYNRCGTTSCYFPTGLNYGKKESK
jgi:hypothetical protein